MRMTVRWSGILTLSVLGAACAGNDDGGLVARAGSHAFTVDDAVEFFSANPTIRPDASMVGELAELWTDYTLIALAAREDSTLATVGLDAILAVQERQFLINRFVEQETPADTVITDEDLRGLWDADPPRGRVRARNILVTTPLNASAAQRDSVRAGLEALRQRVIRGEDFASLAGQYSHDASAELGGDLGWFGRGEMVAPIDAAVYQLEVGEVSDIVQSAFGFHIFRLDDREDPAFDDSKEAFRREVVLLRLQEANSTFIENVLPEITVAEGAPTVAREIARLPRTPLNPRARRRVLAEFENGSLMVGTFWDYLQTRTNQTALQLSESPDDLIEAALHNLAQVEALAELASGSGIEVTEAIRDSIVENARVNIVDAADMMGLRLVAPEPGETGDQAVDRVIRNIVREVLSGGRQPVNLNGATIDLRTRLGGTVVVAGVQATVNRLSERFGPPGARAVPTPSPVDTAQSLPDSAGAR